MFCLSQFMFKEKGLSYHNNWERNTRSNDTKYGFNDEIFWICDVSQATGPTSDDSARETLFVHKKDCRHAHFCRVYMYETKWRRFCACLRRKGTLIVPKHYENLSVLHEGTMPDRAYYVPAGSCMECLDENREASDRITMLNGNWKFRYFDSIYDLQEKF